MADYNVNLKVGKTRWDSFYNQGTKVANDQSKIKPNDNIQFSKNDNKASDDDYMAYAKGYFNKEFNGKTSVSKDQVSKLFPSSIKDCSYVDDNKGLVNWKDISKDVANKMDGNKDKKIDVQEYAAFLKTLDSGNVSGKETPYEMLDKVASGACFDKPVDFGGTTAFEENYDKIKGEYGNSVEPKSTGKQVVKKDTNPILDFLSKL